MNEEQKKVISRAIEMKEIELKSIIANIASAERSIKQQIAYKEAIEREIGELNE